MGEQQKQLILKNLDREEALKEFKELHDELGVALGTGTLIKGEAEQLEKRMAELMCIVEYLDILQGGE
jgi:hypothetical protein